MERVPWEEKQKEEKKRYEQEIKAYRETHKDMPSEEEDEEDGGKGVLHTYSYEYEYMAGMTTTMED